MDRKWIIFIVLLVVTFGLTLAYKLLLTGFPFFSMVCGLIATSIEVLGLYALARWFA
jgi:hypothetical protein